ncbi:MAG: hypothetical protein ACP5OG_01350 [Candidatus Nanoarchaeia archaeon]
MSKLKQALGYIAAGIILAGISGCKEYKTEYSDVKNYDATVTKKEHKDSWTQIIPISTGKVTILAPVAHPEQNHITFKGNLEFILDNKELFERFDLNDKAEVSYKEVYNSVYDDKDKDGNKELIKREITKYEFVDAQHKILERE